MQLTHQLLGPRLQLNVTGPAEPSPSPAGLSMNTYDAETDPKMWQADNRLSMDAQQAYRYMVAVDGVGCPDRLKNLMTSSSVVGLAASELTHTRMFPASYSTSCPCRMHSMRTGGLTQDS